MGLYDDASLVMIPSGVKESKLYSIKPTDGTGDFDFTRGTDTATRVNSAGLIEKVRENLNIYSDPLDAQKGSTSYAAVTYEDNYNWNLGSLLNNAIVFVDNSTTRYAYYNNAVVSGTLYTLSVFMIMDDNSVPVPATDFLIVLGGVSIASGYSVEDYGNNVYRVSVYGISGASNTANGILKVASNSAKGFRISGFQVEQGLVATDYIETTGTTAQAGILEDMPRLDYSGGASCPSLLLEPQRSNLYTYSEYYDTYTKSSCTITSNATTSPEGSQNASKIVSASGGPNIKRIQPSITTTGANEYIISAFAKKAEWDYLFIYGAGTLVNGSLTIFNLDNGTIEQGSAHASIEAFGDDGWYKVTWKATSAGTGTADPRIGITDNSSSSNSTGDGVSGVYLYGLQIEQGSYPTSYIPTMGVSATRSADDMTTTFSSAIATNGSATIFYHELGVADSDDILSTAGNYRYQNDSSNYVSLTTNATAWRVRVQSGGVSNFRGLNEILKTEPIKVAIVVSSTHFSIFANGVKEIDNEALAATSDFSEITKFQTNIADNLGARKTLQHLVFPTALTDSECIALTTL